MINISFELNGREVDPRNMADALEAAVLQSVQQQITQKVTKARCPVHGTAPKIVGRGKSLDSLSFEVSGCCQAVIDATTAALK